MSDTLLQLDDSFFRKPIRHSRFFELTFEIVELAQAFLRNVLPTALVEKLDIDALTVEPKQVFDTQFQEMRADVIYRVPIRDTEKHVDFFVILEHKSYDDFWTIFQVFCYVSRLCERSFKEAADCKAVNMSYRLSPVIAIIIHHGETRFTGSTELSELFYDLPEIAGYLPQLKAFLFDLSTLDESSLPSDPHVPELKAVLTILRVIFSKEVGIKAKDVFEELKPYSDIPKYRTLIRLLCLYLASSAKHLKNQHKEIEKIIEPIVGEKMMSTLYGHGVAKGLRRGKILGLRRGEARGKVLGLQEGEARGKAEAVLHTLTRRLEMQGEAIQQKVSAITDIGKLDELLDIALTCTSLDEFAAALD